MPSLYVGMSWIFQDGSRFGNFQTIFALQWELGYVPQRNMIPVYSMQHGFEVQVQYTCLEVLVEISSNYNGP